MSDQNPPEQGAFGQPAGGTPGNTSGGTTGGAPSEQPDHGDATAPQAAHPAPPAPAQTAPETQAIPASAPAVPSGSSGSSGPSGSTGAPVPPAPQTPPAGGGQTPTVANVQAAVQNVAGDSTGFITALFDFSFTKFVTPMLVRFVYLLATVALVATWLTVLISAFAQNAGLGLVVLVVGPIFVIIYLALIRMTLEFYLSIVRMSEDIHKRLPQA